MKTTNLKQLDYQPKQYSLLAGLLFCAAGLVTTGASTTVTFSVDMTTNYLNGTFNPSTDLVYVDGSFNGWKGLSGAVQLQEVGLGAPYIYTNTVDDTADTNGVMLYKFMCSDSLFVSGPYGYNGYESLCDSRGNRGLYLNGSTMAPPTPFFGDSGNPIVANNVTFQVDMSQQISLGNFNPATDIVDVKGHFDNWNSSAPLVREGASQIYTNTFTSIDVSPNAHMAYGFELNGAFPSYEGISSVDTNNDGGNNRFYTMAPGNQTLPVAFFSDQPLTAVVVSNITFSVDMTLVSFSDTNFDPSTLTINGNFCGWGGNACTNNPMAANTNIYTAIALHTDGSSSFGGYTEALGSLLDYQYRYFHKDGSGPYYDHASGGGDRFYTVVNTNPNGTNIASTWNDASSSDYFLAPQAVTFSVNMKNASGNYETGTDGHQFNPFTDNVYINGFFNGGWFAWQSINPSFYPPGYQMIREGSSSIYTNTIVINPDTVDITYKYGVDEGGVYGGPEDDEAPDGVNHIRVVRALKFSPYQFPTDTFGDQYNEPYFSSNSPAGGDLTVGATNGDSVLVTWLGRPGAHLQVNTNLVSGSWQDIWATDGTNWTTGFGSTNGFVSETNYPTDSGAAYFRLVKP
ncbi:MAG TPA: hypothetical protein VMA35_10220 [Candidatus Sulfopaludibacter sp.]|nr:hypothetical protein [Candidatus Sulfopaludibacter sp.]